nr:26S protease regulatory subunit 8 homolog A [Ipomoea batatas]
MATVEVRKSTTESGREDICSAKPMKQGEGLKQYYMQHIHDLQLQVRQKSHNLNRLEAQRNELNSKVRMLKEELQLLQEPGSYVGEVVKVMGKSKVLVKVHPEGKYVVDVDKSIDITKITPSTRVALRNDSYVLHLILPSKVDPLVNLMKVEKVPDSTYDMIGGLDQQIKEIKEVIELPIKHPELFESLGIAQPKGVLLYGPPGTGKTLLARAVAHHTDCTFIRVSGSELVQKYIGEGSRMVRELFVMAREHAPSIIFMDEIDSIGSARMESGSGNGDSEVQRTMLELLNQLDGFEASNKIKVLMATNRIDILDQALLRPGRIDRKIEFPNPNEEIFIINILPFLFAPPTSTEWIIDVAFQSRWDILKIHSRKMNLMRGIDLKKIAEKMNGASGAELKAVCTEAGMFALRERRVHVTQEDFEMAVAKVMKKDTEKNMSLRKLWKYLSSPAESSCSEGCDLALASYYVGPGMNLSFISKLFSIPADKIIAYNPTAIFPNGDSVLAGTRINVPFPCDCLVKGISGHIFPYSIQAGDTLYIISTMHYSNLTTFQWLSKFDNILVEDVFTMAPGVKLDVIINCSCGNGDLPNNYDLFITYPLSPGESLQSVAKAANVSEDLVRRYNQGVNFSAGWSGELEEVVDMVGNCSYFCGSEAKSKASQLLDELRGVVTLSRVNNSNIDKKISHELQVFSFKSIAMATNNFSNASMLGKGGFGPVYKGTLPDGQEVAIKRLAKSSGQGLLEFKNEILLIARLQHTNLVRLLGCCIEGDEKILIYEYMPNKSLDSFLFVMPRETMLRPIREEDDGRPIREEHDVRMGEGLMGVGLKWVGWAWELWREGRGLELMDPTLSGSCPEAEVMRFIQVGLLCVQDDAKYRPSMSTVVSMLTNESAELPLPKQPAFFIAEEGAQQSESQEKNERLSTNGLTVSELLAR